jgi:hypothetical protein
MERAAELRELLPALARLRDPVGVLSITVGIEPAATTGRSPPWQIAIAHDLVRLHDEAGFGNAAKRRLDEIGARLPELFDQSEPARGRALFATLEGGAVTEVVVPRPLETSVRLGPVAHLMPLAEELEAGAPAGLVSASRDSVVVGETELGQVRSVCRMDVEPWVGDWWPEMKGPAAANPVRGQQVVSQRDRYQKRVAIAQRHALDEACEALASIAAERGWTRAVVAGEAPVAAPLVHALQGGHLETITLAADLAGVREADARSRLSTELGVAAERDRLDRVVDAAQAGRPRAACGLESTLEALGEGRVAELLIDSGRSFLGTVGPAETLTLGAADVEITDWIVAHALVMRATVTPVRGAAADALAGCGGVAALLRW